MPSTNAVWGIDIGQCALKALKLRVADGGRVEVVAFDVIEHAKILSQPDADRDELIKAALTKFVERNEIQGDKFMVGVPGQQTFARFCKMPPIDLKKDAKKIPELVRYEASQQIPFDMDDVVWDYQVFTSTDSPDIEVGIFAIRKDLIRKHLSFFSDVGIAPTGVQTIPAALYNFCTYDGQAAGENTATVLIDVGAQNTDLIIVEPNAAWTRNIPLGGNSFTETLVRSFKLSFGKAEQLKRTAAASKYARQIFQAMRPVFADLVAEIQRSIGFYSSTHRDMELRRVIALGNAFRLPGLQKYLENNLTVPGGVVKLEKFNKVVSSETIRNALFTDNLLTFPAAYGLALQGLAVAKIRASLLPSELARVAVWKKKRPYFIATAASLAAAAAIPVAANWLDAQTLKSPRAEEALRNTRSIISQADKYQREFSQANEDTGNREKDIQSLFDLQKQKRLLPRLLALTTEALPPIRQPEIANAGSPEALRKLIQSEPTRFPRTQRGQLVIEAIDVRYERDVNKLVLSQSASPSAISAEPTSVAPSSVAGGGRAAGGRGRGGRVAPLMAQPVAEAVASLPEAAGFVVEIRGRLLWGEVPSEAFTFVNDYLERLRELTQQPGLGFFVPFEEQNQPKSWVIESMTRVIQGPEDTPGAFAGAGGGRQARGRGVSQGQGGAYGASEGAGGEGGVRAPDPVTGEETATDWRVIALFKVRLGEPPKKVAEAPGDTPAEGGKAQSPSHRP